MNLFDRLERAVTRWEGTVVLNPPANERQLADAETAMGMQLPDDVRAAYLRFNGVTRTPKMDANDDRIISSFFFLPYHDWNSLERVVDRWRFMQSLIEGWVADGSCPDPLGDLVWQHAKNSGIPALHVMLHPRWIPIAGAINEFVHVDMCPAPAGRLGQLVATQTHDDKPTLLANSFTDYLERFLNGLESGELIPEVDSPYWQSRRLGKDRAVRTLADAGL